MTSCTSTATVLLALAATAGVAHAQSETTSQTFDLAIEATPAFLPFNKFDTMGGTRELTGVTLSLDVTATATVTVENYTTNPVAAGTYLLEGAANFVFQAGEANDGGGGEDGRGGSGGGPPFFGLGGIGFDPISDALPAGVEDPGGGPFGPGVIPGTIDVAFGGTINSVLPADPSSFDAFIGTGTFTGIYGVFQDILVSGGPGGFGSIGGFVSRFDQSGTLTITYDYVNVPSPAGTTAMLLGLSGLGLRRRRH